MLILGIIVIGIIGVGLFSWWAYRRWNEFDSYYEREHQDPPVFNDWIGGGRHSSHVRRPNGGPGPSQTWQASSSFHCPPMTEDRTCTAICVSTPLLQRDVGGAPSKGLRRMVELGDE